MDGTRIEISGKEEARSRWISSQDMTKVNLYPTVESRRARACWTGDDGPSYESRIARRTGSGLPLQRTSTQNGGGTISSGTFFDRGKEEYLCVAQPRILIVIDIEGCAHPCTFQIKANFRGSGSAGTSSEISRQIRMMHHRIDPKRG